MNGRLILILAIITLGSVASTSWGQGYYINRCQLWGSDLPVEVRGYFAPPGSVGNRVLRQSYGKAYRQSIRNKQPAVNRFSYKQSNAGGYVPANGKINRQQIIEAAHVGRPRYRAASSITSMRSETNIRHYSNR